MTADDICSSFVKNNRRSKHSYCHVKKFCHSFFEISASIFNFQLFESTILVLCVFAYFYVPSKRSTVRDALLLIRLLVTAKLFSWFWYLRHQGRNIGHPQKIKYNLLNLKLPRNIIVSVLKLFRPSLADFVDGLRTQIHLRGRTDFQRWKNIGINWSSVLKIKLEEIKD